jgi:hypothetical protein
MRISLASFVLAMLAEVAVARNCNAGLDYCGTTLRSIGRPPGFKVAFGVHPLTWHPGDYDAEIKDACRAYGISCDGSDGDNVLFKCVGRTLGNTISVAGDCVEYGLDCVDGGSGKSDECGRA